MFKPVSSQVDFPALERELLDFWYKEGVLEDYLKRNESSNKKFSFLDGPITANNPMGVHHAWGRTYKDLWQRWYNMRGFKERFQNGFDEQGLWVEVNVEKDLDLHSKRDIENLIPGDKFASLEKFVNLCKERVEKFSAIQTEQSKRLGYFMDWDNSYHTSSDKNNYTIWYFLKIVNEKGWLYKGHDSVPWCPRCGTAISQHEILTEEYKLLNHESIYFKLPIKNIESEYLLVWTTTPWTIPANVAVAINEEETYVKVKTDKGNLWLIEKAIDRLKEKDVLAKELEILDKKPGKELVGLQYEGPFDYLPRVQKAMGDQPHQVVIGDPQILPVGSEEGTGMVHVAPGAGSEDFQLGKKLGLPVIEVIDESAIYLEGMAEFSGQNAKKHPELIIDFLKQKDNSKFLLTTQWYQHRYPTCWRCKTELVWRVVDEWYIGMDKTDDSGKTYREQMIEVIKKINWMPKWGYDRELDWLKNMHDWLISKKRYWGLALPIWECQKCDNFEVIGGFEELKEKSVEGWNEFEGHSPHKPWIDQIKIKCSKCGEIVSRIPDVGNPWLDAGIVPFSTMPEDWFPANFVTEGFPGQFKNWFYSLIAMSTALKRTNPFENLLGFANVVDEKGEEMHKSKGNAIEFNEAADKAGVDVMRWLYLTQNPEDNLKFGYGVIDDIRRRFYLIFWNIYKYFVDYALVNDWKVELPKAEKTVLDEWILAKLNLLVDKVNDSLSKFDAATASRNIEDFVINDLSTWYIRRSRDRVGANAESKERNLVLSILNESLITLSKLIAPFMPFIAEEIYKNLTNERSVHLTDYPEANKNLINEDLVESMKLVRQVVEQGHAKRKDASIKLRQPLSKVIYQSSAKLDVELEKIVGEELNVKEVIYSKPSTKETENLGVIVTLDTNITEDLAKEGEARELIRQIQQMRKESNLTLKDRIEITASNWPKDFEEMILKGTAAEKITQGEPLAIKKL